MTYILTLWLLVAGEHVNSTIELPGYIDCPATAAATAEENSAELIEFSCVLEIGV